MRTRGTLVALLATVAFAACAPTPSFQTILPGPSATVGPTFTQPATLPPITAGPSSAPTETPGAAAGPCDPADLKASHGLVEGGAGSIFTEVILVSAATCSVDAYPAMGLRDANGGPLVSAPAAGPGFINLASGVAYSTNVRLGNWCLPDPAFPVSLVVIMPGGELAVTGTSFPEDGDLPSCNGDGGPNLVASAWTPEP
jgi:hypothetical protein